MYVIQRRSAHAQNVCLQSGSGKRSSCVASMESSNSVATATVDLDKLILDFSTWEEVLLTYKKTKIK